MSKWAKDGQFPYISLLNDEQMSNWVGVKHLPVIFLDASWWQLNDFLSSPLSGEDCQFDEHVFQMGGSTTN